MKVLIVGCGNMGVSHALAYQNMDDCQVVGLVNRSIEPRELLSKQLGGVKHYQHYETALRELKPDIVTICTHSAFHADYAKKAFLEGAHVFVEKPIATSVKEAKEVVDTARLVNKKLVVGYILRHHPTWQKFIEYSKELGSPKVMRLNLNQQSDTKSWQTLKKILELQSPIVDCGVHYVDVMCQMTESNPIKVSAIGARTTDEIDPDMYNYGQLQVEFEDGSVGWYEAGWGPMVSETAHFIKDVFGPKGSISMAPKMSEGDSCDIHSHTKAEILKRHFASVDNNGYVTHNNQIVELEDEPNHNELCQLEQEFLVRAIKEDLDLSEHYQAAINSLAIVLAADRSIKEKRVVYLEAV